MAISRRSLWLTLLAGAAVTGGCFWASGWWSAPVELPLIDGSTVTVVPGVHLLGGLGPSAAYAIETSQGLVLIDSGLETDAGPLRAEAARLHLDVSKLQAVFLTHVHGDHCGGAEYLRSATGAKIYAGQGDADLLRAGTPRDAFFSVFSMPNHEPHATSVDVELRGGEQIAFGDVRVQAIATPGHTPGSTCYLVERRGLRILFSGDVIMNLTDKPLGTYSAYLAPRYRGDATAYLASLRKLRAMPVPDLVLRGHPSANSEPRTPRPTAKEWNEMLDAGIRDMERLIQRYAADGVNFLDGQPKQLLPDLYYFGDFQGSAVYGFFADSKFFVFNAPGGAGLNGFLDDACRQLGLTPPPPTAVLLTECVERESAGLRELIEKSHAQVVVGAAGLDAMRSICPADTMFCEAGNLAGQGWFSAMSIALGGRGLASVGYLIRLSGKSVLFSGRNPIVIDRGSHAALLRDLSEPQSDVREYIASLRKLAGLRPDLWLPATPVNSQNANLYDNAWPELLEKNYRAVSNASRRQ